MFQSPLVNGLTRCVSSGYIGFGGKYLSTIEKPPASGMNEIATNPVTGQDLFNLAAELKLVFSPISISSREILENIHYIKEIFMACHFNKFNLITLIVRDNLGDQFVVNFNIDNIPKKKIAPRYRIGGDEEFPIFLFRLNSKYFRILILKYLAALKIPILSSKQPLLKIWIAPGKFNLPIAQKFKQAYINGLAETIWPNDSIGTREQLIPKIIKKSFEEVGQDILKNK